jgi:hypothetical protein
VQAVSRVRRERRSLAVSVGALAVSVAALGTAAVPVQTAAAATACAPLWSDSSSDATVTPSQQDQLDIVAGSLSDNGSTLTTTLTIKNLSTTVATGATANEYYFVLSVNGTSYYTNVEVSALGTTYNYGTYASTTGFSGVGSAGGSFTPGANGTFEVTVPLGSVGGPSGTLPAGGIFGETRVLRGAPGAGGIVSSVDKDQATSAYVMGSCASPAPPTPAAGPTVTTGAEAFANYGAPPNFQNRDALQRPNAGEPSVGADWKSGALMFMAGTQVSQVSFDTSSPPAATWVDVTPTQLANASEDSILFTDNVTNRTWAEDFLVAPACNANMAYTDTSGGSGGATSNTAWTPEQCPYAEGPDHPSVGAGPYHGAQPATATYPHAVYYCSQNILVAAGAECTLSQDGGLTWLPPAHIFGTGTPCGSIHGHIRVSPDGTMYVPQNSCGGHQGMAVTQDNGSTYTYATVPDSASGKTDPSVAADAANTVYYGYEDGNGHPKIAVSQDHGATWSPSADVGAPFGINHSKFPEVIAGDAGRAAYAFLGTACPNSQPGCSAGDQSPSFSGVWYLYVSYTFDGGRTWRTVNATPDNPVQRGCIWNGGGSNPCRNLLDFNDITVDKTGHVYVGYTDGCTADPGNAYNCNTTPAIDQSGCDKTGSVGAGVYSENASEYSTATCTYGRQSSLVRQVCGEGLFAAADPGFSEAPSCLGVAVPEARSTTMLLLTGAAGLAVFGVLTVRRRRRGVGLQTG